MRSLLQAPRRQAGTHTEACVLGSGLCPWTSEPHSVSSEHPWPRDQPCPTRGRAQEAAHSRVLLRRPRPGSAGWLSRECLCALSSWPPGCEARGPGVTRRLPAPPPIISGLQLGVGKCLSQPPHPEGGTLLGAHPHPGVLPLKGPVLLATRKLLQTPLIYEFLTRPPRASVSGECGALKSPAMGAA